MGEQVSPTARRLYAPALSLKAPLARGKVGETAPGLRVWPSDPAQLPGLSSNSPDLRRPRIPDLEWSFWLVEEGKECKKFN